MGVVFDAVFEELKETSGLIIGLILALVIMGLIGYALTNVRGAVVSPFVRFIKRNWSVENRCSGIHTSPFVPNR